jgi:hypothetical protein
MSVDALDALRLARRLRDVGCAPDRATGVAEAFAETLAIDIAASHFDVIRRIAPPLLAQAAPTMGMLLRLPDRSARKRRLWCATGRSSSIAPRCVGVSGAIDRCRGP